MLEIPDGQTAPQTFTKAFSPSTIGPVGQVRTKNQHAQDHGQEQRAKQWKGLTSIMEGQLEQAVEHLLQALRDEPNNPESHYNLGLALLGRDEDDRARKHFAEAVRLRPNMLLGWYNLGRANANLDRSDEAIESFKRALAVEPSQTRSYVELGKALVAQGNREEAIRYYRHGLKAASQLAPIAKALDEIDSEPQ